MFAGNNTWTPPPLTSGCKDFQKNQFNILVNWFNLQSRYEVIMKNVPDPDNVIKITMLCYAIIQF